MMITFETALTLTVSILVGYISIVVSTHEKNGSKKDNSQSKPNKINRYVTAFFALCLFIVWAFFFFDTFFIIFAFQQVVEPLQQVINVVTPINGRLFSNEAFSTGYWGGLAMIDFPTMACAIERYWKGKKTVGERIFTIFGVLLLIAVVSAWVEYYLSASAYNTFVEFSSIHFFIANAILNIIPLIVGICIMSDNI